MLAAVALSRHACSAESPWIIGLTSNLSYLACPAAVATVLLLIIWSAGVRLRRAVVGSNRTGIWKGRPNRVGAVLWIVTVLASGAWAILPVAPMIVNAIRLFLNQTVAQQPASATNAGPSTQYVLIRMLVCNLGDQYDALTPLWQVADREQADVILLAEVNPPVASAFVSRPEVVAEYPFAEIVRREMSWHMAVLSRWPLHAIEFDNTDFERFKHLFAYRQSLFVDIPAGGRFLLAGIHAPSPRSAETWSMGNETITLLIECVQRYLLPTGAPVIVAGDFNSTPSGYRYRAMLHNSGLHSADEVATLSGTWPADFAIGATRLMLDHVWGSHEVYFQSHRVLENVGSDHCPLLVDFQIPVNSAQPTALRWGQFHRKRVYIAYNAP